VPPLVTVKLTSAFDGKGNVTGLSKVMTWPPA
jgi:hypothetical protein